MPPADLFPCDNPCFLRAQPLPGNLGAMLTSYVRALRHPVDAALNLRAAASRRFFVKVIEQNGERYYSYKGELYPAYLNEGGAAAFILDKASGYCSGKGLDIGAGAWPLPGAIPIQDEARRNAYELSMFPDESLDYVFSSHCLEHLKQWRKALRIWIRKLRPGGHIVLYLPHESMRLWAPGGPWVGSSHRWAPTAGIVAAELERNGLTIVERDDGPDRYFSFYIAAEKSGG